MYILECMRFVFELAQLVTSTVSVLYLCVSSMASPPSGMCKSVTRISLALICLPPRVVEYAHSQLHAIMTI